MHLAKQIKADIDFEKELWDAANTLFGAVAENEYKNYILPLIFVKHLSDRYRIRRAELEQQIVDESLDSDEAEYILADRDEYISHNAYPLPEDATWEYLLNNAGQDDIKVKVDNTFVLIDDLLGDMNSDLKGILPPVFVKSQITARETAKLINLFSKDKFSEQKNPESDILGRIYEFYIGKCAMAEGAGAGQFFTPGSVVRLLVEMLEPLHGRIFDPACGSGGMFTQSIKFIQAHGGERSDISIFGQERYEGTLRLCKMNLVLRNLSFDVRLGDSLLHDKHASLKADFVIANPPFNKSQWDADDLADTDPRLLGPKNEFTTDGSANYMWMQTFWSHLSEKGTAGFVMANGAMTTGNAGEKNVRQYMVDNGMVDCIVRMPDKLFMTTGIPACLFFLSKNRDGSDGIHRERKNEMLFIDASKMGEMVTRKLRVFSDEDISRITDTYHHWRNASNEYEDVEGFCKVATLEEVQAQDYKLTPGIYVGTEAEEDDGIPFDEKMAVLKAQLQDQFAQANVLQQRITANLEEF